MITTKGVHRICLSSVAAAAVAVAALSLSSCALPGTVATGSAEAYPAASGTVTAFSMRQKYGGTAPRYGAARVENTTREDFFAWLFSTDSAEKKKPVQTKPVGPVIPATKVNQGVLAKSNQANTRVVVDISRQKAFLLVNGSVAIEAPVSTARPGKRTPRGSYRVTERVRSGKISTIYGVGMPYWMRLSGSVYGVHAGYLPGYPASAGCIRLPRDAAQLIFDNTKHGTRVSIYDAWDGA